MSASLTERAKLMTELKTALDLNDKSENRPISDDEEVQNLWNSLVQTRKVAASASQEAELARNESARLRERIHQLDLECSFLKKSVESKQIDFKMLQELEASVSHQYSHQNREIDQLRLKYSEAEARLLEAQNILELERQMKSESESEINRLLTLCTNLERRLREKTKLASDVKKLRAVEALYIQQTEQIETILEQEIAVKSKAAQLERYEERLRSYVTTLNAQKNEIKKIAGQLAEELEAARTIHPVQDYLTLTEFELSKIELQLRKTPTSSPDRPKLEACLAPLTEQRDFLKTMIDESQRKIQEQASIILRIFQDVTLAPMPPTPPAPQNLPSPQTPLQVKAPDASEV